MENGLPGSEMLKQKMLRMCRIADGGIFILHNPQFIFSFNEEIGALQYMNPLAEYESRLSFVAHHAFVQSY